MCGNSLCCICNQKNRKCCLLRIKYVLKFYIKLAYANQSSSVLCSGGRKWLLNNPYKTITAMKKFLLCNVEMCVDIYWYRSKTYSPASYIYYVSNDFFCLLITVVFDDTGKETTKKTTSYSWANLRTRLCMHHNCHN